MIIVGINAYHADSSAAIFVNGKMIFLSGSPELERIADIPTGRLSGIVNHHIPKYFRSPCIPGKRLAEN